MLIDPDLANVGQEGTDPFAELNNEETVTPPAPPADEKPGEGTPPSPQGGEPEGTAPDGDNTEEDNSVPFHKHPRWIERENELKELRQFREETAHALQELEQIKTAFAQNPNSQGGSAAPQWFRDKYGDNPEAWQFFSQFGTDLKQQVRQEIEHEKQAEVDNQKRWEGWIDSEVKRLQEAGNKFDSNALLKVMNEYTPTNGQGHLDFDKGLKILQQLEASKGTPTQAATTAKKAVAAATTTTKAGEGKGKDYMTSNDLRNKSWFDL